MTVVNAAEIDGPFGGLCERHARAAAFAENALVGHLVIFGFATEILGRDLLQLVLGVESHSIGRACMRVSGLATARWATPREISGSAAPGDLAFLPWHT